MNEIYLIAKATQSRKIHPITEIVGFAQSKREADQEVERLNRLHVTEYKTFTAYPVNKIEAKETALTRTACL